MINQIDSKFAPLDLTRHSHGIGHGGRGIKIATCANCNRKDIALCFRSPQSVAAQNLGLTPQQNKGEPYRYAMRCPTCFSDNIESK